VGGVFPFAGSIPPAPAVRPSPDGPALALPRPDLTAVRTADPLLTDALEARRSIRVPGEEPISLDQLGEFLYRIARIRAVTSEETDGHIPYPITTRPYPSGGASYDVEFWLTIGRCRGAEPGIYYYDPYAHRLVLVNADAGDRDLVLGRAGRAINDGGPPDVAVTLTSRVQRVSWKYAGMAYATTMKHVGVVYQTMYLVATAMRLAGCAVGNGDSREAERILGLDPLCEPAVGEFVLSAAPQPTAPAHPEARHDAWVPVHGYDWHLSSRTELEHLASSREGRTG
jgi:SagB-type dehydrogenase family enzyme